MHYLSLKKEKVQTVLAWFLESGSEAKKESRSEGGMSCIPPSEAKKESRSEGGMSCILKER
jgi:hypothetical protein